MKLFSRPGNLIILVERSLRQPESSPDQLSRKLSYIVPRSDNMRPTDLIALSENGHFSYLSPTLGQYLENTAHIAYETNFNDRPSRYFYCCLRTEVVIYGHVSC